MANREYIQLRATTDREKLLAKVKDRAEVDGDSEAIDLALAAYVQLDEIADEYEQQLEEMQAEFNHRDGAMSFAGGGIRRS